MMDIIKFLLFCIAVSILLKCCDFIEKIDVDEIKYIQIE